MLGTPKSGLYNGTDRPTILQILADVPTAISGYLVLPDDMSNQSKSDLQLLIRTQYGDMQTICQTAAHFTTYLPIWCKTHLDGWTRILDALTAEYEPLENYSMVEEETPAETTETETPAETTKTVTPAETTDTETPAGTTRTLTPAETTDTETPAQVTDTGSRTDGIFGFDNTTDTPTPADTSNGSTVRTVQAAGTNVLTTQNPGTDVLSVDSAGSLVRTTQSPGTESLDVDTSGSRVLTVQNPRSLTRSGNIGVTTSQMMLESEVSLRIKWNMMQIIMSDFLREICVGVW